MKCSSGRDGLGFIWKIYEISLLPNRVNATSSENHRSNDDGGRGRPPPSALRRSSVRFRVASTVIWIYFQPKQICWLDYFLLFIFGKSLATNCGRNSKIPAIYWQEKSLVVTNSVWTSRVLNFPITVTDKAFCRIVDLRKMSKLRGPRAWDSCKSVLEGLLDKGDRI